MNRNNHRRGLTDLGRVRTETRGGAEGYMDLERTKWLHSLGLAND